MVYIILQLIVIFGSIPFARYNLQLGRCDTRGAIRLGLFATAIGMGAWLIGGAHVFNVEETDLFFMAAMRALFTGVTMAVTYVSFEPFVRRKWPQTLISWSRLLAGGFRDPLVGRDVLIGSGIGLALALIQGVGTLSYGWLGIPAVRVRHPASGVAGRPKHGGRGDFSDRRRAVQGVGHSVSDFSGAHAASEAVAGCGNGYHRAGRNHRAERSESSSSAGR